MTVIFVDQTNSIPLPDSIPLVKKGPNGRNYQFLKSVTENYSPIRRICLLVQTLAKVIFSAGFFCISSQCHDDWQTIKTGKKIITLYELVEDHAAVSAIPGSQIPVSKMGLQESNLSFYQDSARKIWAGFKMSEEEKKSFPAANYFIILCAGTRSPKESEVIENEDFQKLNKLSETNGLPTYCISLNNHEHPEKWISSPQNPIYGGVPVLYVCYNAQHEVNNEYLPEFIKIFKDHIK